MFRISTIKCYTQKLVLVSSLKKQTCRGLLMRELGSSTSLYPFPSSNCPFAIFSSSHASKASNKLSSFLNPSVQGQGLMREFTIIIQEIKFTVSNYTHLDF